MRNPFKKKEEKKKLIDLEFDSYGSFKDHSISPFDWHHVPDVSFVGFIPFNPDFVKYPSTYTHNSPLLHFLLFCTGNDEPIFISSKDEFLEFYAHRKTKEFRSAINISEFKFKHNGFNSNKIDVQFKWTPVEGETPIFRLPKIITSKLNVYSKGTMPLALDGKPLRRPYLDDRSPDEIKISIEVQFRLKRLLYNVGLFSSPSLLKTLNKVPLARIQLNYRITNFGRVFLSVKSTAVPSIVSNFNWQEQDLIYDCIEEINEHELKAFIKPKDHNKPNIYDRSKLPGYIKDLN